MCVAMCRYACIYLSNDQVPISDLRSRQDQSAITKGPDLAYHAIALAAAMFSLFHFVDATRQQRRESQTNTTEAPHHSQYGGRGTAPGVAAGFDAGESHLSAVRAGYGDGLPSEVG